MIFRAIGFLGYILISMSFYFFVREGVTGIVLENINPHDYLQDGLMSVIISKVLNEL